MRVQLFDKIVRSRVPEGCIMPTWAVVLRWILFPLDSVRWSLSSGGGYQLQSDTWVINGVQYSGAALREIAQSTGELYLITRIGEVITFERVML